MSASSQTTANYFQTSRSLKMPPHTCRSNCHDHTLSLLCLPSAVYRFAIDLVFSYSSCSFQPKTTCRLGTRNPTDDVLPKLRADHSKRGWSEAKTPRIRKRRATVDTKRTWLEAPGEFASCFLSCSMLFLNWPPDTPASSILRLKSGLAWGSVASLAFRRFVLTRLRLQVASGIRLSRFRI